MKLKRNARKRKYIMILLLLLLCISIGYASIASGLLITGNTEINSAEWNVHFDNVRVTEGSSTSSYGDYEYKEVTLDPSKTVVTYDAILLKRGDFYEFTFDVVNDGTIDAKIEGIIKNIQHNFNLAEYTVVYADNNEQPAKGDVVEAGSSRKLKMRIQYREDLEAKDLLDRNVSIKVYYELSFVQV